MLALTTYTFFKFLHVLLAIVAVGFNAAYGVLLARAAREPEHVGHVLRTVKVLDDRFANPAYALLLVTGLVMVFVGDVDLTQFWLATAIGLYLLAVILGIFVYSPTLRSQIRVVEADGVETEEFRRLSSRGAIVGGILAAIVVTIVFLMVTKPVL
ncbi:MAG TPA: DUF2269 family protein [Actinomycetota bacterium]